MPATSLSPPRLPRTVRRRLTFALSTSVFLAAVITLLPQCGRAPAPPLVVIGLDGATWELLDPWIAAGKLPNFAALRDRSAYGTLNSVMPYLSPPAWTSATTGVNPGSHGIFDFQRRLPGDDKIVSETANSRRTQPIWNYLKGRGPRVCIINVPMTDPPDEVNGVMVSGFPHPSGKVGVYPRERRAEIEAMGYLRDQMEMKLPIGQEAAVFDSLLLIQEKRFELTRKLFQEEPWDFFWVVFTQTDRVQHLFWKFDDPESPVYDPELAARFGGSIEKLWRRNDELLGEFLALIPADAHILVLSDHGFGPIHREFRVGNFLRTAESGFAEDEARDVFSLDKSDAARLYVRQKEKDPGGTRTSAQARALEEKLAARLRAVRDPLTGASPFDRVDRRDSIFVGPNTEKGPNLNITPARGWFVSRGDEEEGYQLESFGDPRSSLSGWHRMNGIFMLAGPSAKPGPLPASSVHSLLDIVPTCLYLLGEAIPLDLHGRLIETAIEPRRLASEPPRHDGRLAPESRELSPEELERLKEINIPYIGG